MATPFETYIQTELPLRSATLTPSQCGGYDGDPNDLGAPTILQNAPLGTLYWEATATKFWRRQATAWVEDGGGGGGSGVTTYTTELALLVATPAEGTIGYAQDSQRYWFRGASSWAPKANLSTQIGSLVFPIDYATGTDPDPGTVFCTAADITAYMADRGITYFKTIIGCFRCLPDIVTSSVYFYLQPGVHRPLPYTDQYQNGPAWNFRPQNNAISGVRRHPLYFQESARLNFTPPSPTAAAAWETLIAGETCTASSTTGPLGLDCYLDFAAASYTPGALKGYFVWIPSATPQRIPIRDNTATRISLCANYTGTVVGLSVSIVQPSTVLRNSFDDSAIAYGSDAMLDIAPDRWAAPAISSVFTFDSLRFEQFSASGSYPAINLRGPIRGTFTRCLWDQAGRRDLGLPNSAGHAAVAHSYLDEPAYVSFTQCSIRGNRIAAVPANGTRCLYLGSTSTFRPGMNAMGQVVLSQNYMAGCGSLGSEISNCRVELNSTMFDVHSSSSISLLHCDLVSGNSSSRPRNFFRAAANGINITGRADIYAAFEAITSYFVAGSGDLNLAYSVDGPGGGNTGTFLTIASGSSQTRAIIRAAWAATTSGAELNHGPSLSLATLRGLCKPISQPGNTLYGAVIVLAVSDYTMALSTVDCTLKYTTVGTTLQFHHYADGVGLYGPAVNVGAGGFFFLAGANPAYWCTVLVVAAALPGANSTQNFTIANREVNASLPGSWLVAAPN